MYDLIAVVTHEGKLENGHYWADVKSGTEWFRCDDDKSECSMIPCIHFDQFADGHHSHRDDLECRARSTSLSAILSQEVCSLPGVDYVQARSEKGLEYTRISGVQICHPFTTCIVSEGRATHSVLPRIYAYGVSNNG